MKGIFEEYGTFVVSAMIGLLVLSFLFTSISSPEGALHKLTIATFKGVGVESQVILEEWDIGSIHVVLKDDGGLYFTGTGTLPTYSSVEESPWANEVGHIDFVEVEDGVTVSGEIPIG